MFRRGHEFSREVQTAVISEWLNTRQTWCKNTVNVPDTLADMDVTHWALFHSRFYLQFILICIFVSFCFVTDFIGWLFNCQSSVVLMAVIDRFIYDIWRILNLSDHWEIFQIIPEKVPAADPWIWPTDWSFLIHR